MPIAIGDEYYEDEFEYTAKVLGIELPQATESKPKEASGSSQTQGGTQVPPKDLNASAGNVAGVRGLLEAGNIDIHNRPVVKNPDGSISTVLSKSFNFDGKETLIPTVAADGSGILSDDDAIAQYRKTGQHLGIFDNPDDADAYGQSLHNQQAEEYVKPRYQTWPERMVRGAISAMALPGDVLSGKVKPGSAQEIERAMDLAGLMVFGPAPVASKMAEGTLGSFAGVTSKTLDRNRLAQAQLLDAKNVHPDDIWKNTGFFKGADDRWKYSILDKDAKITKHGFDTTIEENPFFGGELTPMVSVKQTGTTLGEALEHPELFKAYPHLKDIKVLPLPKSIADRGTIGQMSGDTMYLRDDLHPDFARSVILHELQHSIQAKEGFARGGNSLEFRSPALKTAADNFEKVRAATEEALMKEKGWSKSDIREYKRILNDKDQTEFNVDLWKKKHPDAYNRLKDIVDSEKLLKEQSDIEHTKYTRLMGEVEARNVQTRMNYDKFQDYMNTPRSTEDVPRFLQEKR